MPDYDKFEKLGDNCEICVTKEHTFGTDAFLLADFAKEVETIEIKAGFLDQPHLLLSRYAELRVKRKAKGMFPHKSLLLYSVSQVLY